jgi:glycosyltransferase involved in cell wall biosynthesis
LNEEASLPHVLQRIPRAIAGVEAVEVLVVDDGSTDGSAGIARQHGAHVLSHMFNMGVGQAFHTALEYALEHGHDGMVSIDADGQFSPEQIPLVLDPILRGQAEFVTGSRFLNNRSIPHMSAVKRWGNARMTRLINRLTGQRFTDVSCGFRAYSRQALLRLNLHGQFTYTQETFLSLVFNNVKIAEVPIDVRYFPDRQSRVAGNILQYALRTSNIIFRTYRDYRPLRFFWSAAFVVMMPALGFAGFLLAWRVYSGEFSPHIWSGFVGGFLFFIATALFIIGLMADMMGRSRRNQEEILYYLKRGMRG